MSNRINKVSLPPNLYQLLSAIFSNNQIWWILPCYEVHHLHYTNWWLKICIWQLYFSSWWPKGDLRIFFISSPGLWLCGMVISNIMHEGCHSLAAHFACHSEWRACLEFCHLEELLLLNKNSVHTTPTTFKFTVYLTSCEALHMLRNFVLQWNLHITNLYIAKSWV